MEKVFGFSRLLVSAESVDAPFAQPMLERFRLAGIPTEMVTTPRVDAHPWALMRGTLILLPRPMMGWITPAQHGSLAVREAENYLHPIIGCQAGCTYCYLQARPEGRRPLRMHVRVDELIRAVEEHANRDEGTGPLFSTGELADSLLDAELFPVAAVLVKRFAETDIGRLELRTKSARVESLLDIEHRRQTTVAFSLAPAHHIRWYEPGTASLGERLDAASRLADVGYPVAIKCEPVILDEGWETAYEEMFRLVAQTIGPPRLDHVSVGCLRWSPELAKLPAFRRRHGNDLAEGTWIEYRPDRYNGTLRKQDRLNTYAHIREMLHASDIRCPIWWSLEEADVIAQLDAAGSNPGRPKDPGRR